MSAYRKHHYVPRFYLRNFAATGGRSIHLFNIPLGRNILNASLRNQCYSARFYGDDPIIEHTLAKIEGAAATVFRDILTTKRLPTPGSVGHHTLMIFTMTQRARTQTSAITTDATTDKMLKTAYREDPRIKDLDIEGLRIVLENSVLLPLRISASMVPVTFDLQLHLLVNDTETQFITSDNPVVLHNTHCQNITIRGCIGWGCAGLEVFLPLSPGICLYAYDATVYRIASQYSQVTCHHGMSSCSTVYSGSTPWKTFITLPMSARSPWQEKALGQSTGARRSISLSRKRSPKMMRTTGSFTLISRPD